MNKSPESGPTYRIVYGEQPEDGLGLGEVSFSSPDSGFESLATGKFGNEYDTAAQEADPDIIL